MNCDPILRAAIKRAAASYGRGEIDVETMTRLGKRISTLRRRSCTWEGVKRRRRNVIANGLRALMTARKGIELGERFVAFDVGYEGSQPLNELGITTWDGETFSTTNYRVTGYRNGETDCIPCLFGPTFYLGRQDILLIAREEYEAADIAVFHAAHCDLPKLDLDTSKTFFVDTSAISLVWYPRDPPSLEALCERYGLDNSHWHNSGNDSRRTMEVLLARVSDDRPPVARYGSRFKRLMRIQPAPISGRSELPGTERRSPEPI